MGHPADSGLGSPEPPSGSDSERSRRRRAFPMRASDTVTHSHYDSNFVQTHFQEFQHYDFQIIIAAEFHTESNLSCISRRLQQFTVFRLPIFNARKAWTPVHVSLRFKGKKIQILRLHWVLPLYAKKSIKISAQERLSQK